TSISRILSAWLATAVVALFSLAAAFAQLPPEVAKSGYADTVFVNGKVVSMDDTSSSTSPGHIYQAIAVKGDKIMKLGSSDEVRALAGPDTKVLDLKGRPLLPGIIEPHNHVYGSVTRYMDKFGFKFPPNGIIVEAEGDKDLEKTQAIIRDAIRDSVKKVKSGEWVVLRLRASIEAPGSVGLWGMTRRLTNRKTLDTWAPNNPVLVNPGLRGTINSKALEVLNDFLPGYSASIQETMHGIDIGEDVPGIGWVGSQEMDVINWELFMQRLPPATLAQMLKLVSEDLAATGVTTFSSRVQFPKIMTRYATLTGIGQMPIRFDAHYEVHRMPTEPSQTRQMYRRTGVLQGIGNDYFWIDGVASERWDSIYPESCTGPDTKAPPHIKAREVCPKPGDLPWDVLENAMKAGWRLAGVHICGSESARQFFKLIDRARAVNGWTIQEVHDMHMTGEHCNVVGKLPDVIEGLKKYGIILSCGTSVGETEAWISDYGPEIAPFVKPFKTWIDSGVKLVGQSWGYSVPGTMGFRPPFSNLWNAVTRKANGKVWEPEERIDRVQALKMWTSWASEYVQKKDKLGTLEVGKFADLLVIDRDYFTIPEDDILKVHPLMTMVGGKIIVLQQSLAKDFGMQPVGPVFDFTDADVDHIGKPLAEVVKKFKEKERNAAPTPVRRYESGSDF
ncbi:MAG: amidohydrolase family protein, partial [Acidobacteria bacterium]|nr:amidohydrolase family protein [Acidobacteriota bacterium]